MLPKSISYFWLAVAAIPLVGILSTARAHANLVTYGEQPAAIGGAQAAQSRLESSAVPVLQLDSAGATYALAIPDGRGTSQEVDFSSSREGAPVGLAAGHGANSFHTTAVSTTSVAQSAAEPDKTPTSVTLLLRELLIGLTVAEAAASSLSRSVPQPGALILLGLALVALACGIRRMTGRKDADTDDGQAANISMGTAAEEEYADRDFRDPVASVFHQHTSSRNDTISLSQQS